MLNSFFQLQVNENFNMQALVDSLVRLYQTRGYFVNMLPSPSNVIVRIEKNNSGISTIVGLCEGITLNINQNGPMLNVAMVDGAWTDKIIGFFLGWATCGIIWIFTGIGFYRQLQLASNVKTDVFMILSGNGATTGPFPFG
ncbi:MAG TPA: hypothetical protein GXX17_01625 [Clostridiales bacterium]|nr:hypothetical protein [Clostridiales bacterium]